MVTLSSPVNCQLGTATATGTIINDDSTPLPTLAIASVSANKPEGSTGVTAFTFDVTRTGDLSGTTDVDWEVSGIGVNPANAADFQGGVLPSGTLSYLATESVKTITVNVVGDTTLEPNEDFRITLFNPVGATITGALADGIIQNDDAAPPPVISIVAVSADKAEGNTGGSTAFTFNLTRTGDLTATSQITWVVAGAGVDPAEALDFVGDVYPGATETFAISEASKQITINVKADLDIEADENFSVTLSGAVNATIGTGTAFGVIRDDDSVFVWPNASNTGVPAGTTLTTDSAGGEFFTSSVGQIIQDIDFTNRAVQIVHDNVVIRRCRLTSAGVWYGIWINGANNVTIEDCEINGNGPAVNSQGIVIDGTGAILRRNNVHHCSDGIIPGPGATITYNYIHDPDGFGVFPDNPHADTFQCQGGQTNNLIQDNWISIRHQNNARGEEICNAGIYFTANGVPISNNIVDHNVIDPGQAFYCVYSNDNSQYAPGPNPASTVTGQQFTNNYFMDGTRTTAGSVHVPDQGSEAHILVWTNNRHWVTNAVIPREAHVVAV